MSLTLSTTARKTGLPAAQTGEIMSSPIEPENPATPDSEIVKGFPPGRYLSDNGRWALELRIEVQSAPSGASTSDAMRADGPASTPAARDEASSVSSVYRITPSELASRVAARAATTISGDLRSNGEDGPQEFYVRSRLGTTVKARDD